MRPVRIEILARFGAVLAAAIAWQYQGGRLDDLAGLATVAAETQAAGAASTAYGPVHDARRCAPGGAPRLLRTGWRSPTAGRTREVLELQC